MWPFSLFQSKPEPKAQNNPTPKNVVPAAASVAPVALLSPVAPASAGIPFNPTLIDKLKGDHQELFAIYTRLHESATSARFAKITEDIIVLRRVFNGHILLENVRFYVYLERLLKNHPEEKNYVHSLRKDMNGIANAVSTFCEKWITSPVTNLTQSAFTAELQGIGGALTSRVQLEETTLYTLYVESL
jgi:hypothetical protein